MPNFYPFLLKASAAAIAVAFASIGPYLHYQSLQPQGAAEPSQMTDARLSTVQTAAPDFAAIQDTKQKKQAFFDYLRPKIALENQRIEKERTFLTSVDLNNIDDEQNDYAKRLGHLYSLSLTDGQITETWLNEMLKRVNVLPEALVLSQAANESAWGTSRFAKEANNFFGQWCYTKGCGLVPARRNVGAKHEVEKFHSAQEAVHRYFMNVNRNRAYEPLRTIRQQLQKQGVNLLSVDAALQEANGLGAYSERGEHYIKEVQDMIRHNQSFWTN